MSVRALVNGRPADEISLGDRGLHYGDGLFETMAVRVGQICRLERHLARLERGCLRLALPMPAREVLLQELTQLAAGEERAVLKLVLTRGTGARGYRAPEGLEPTRIVTVHPWPAWPSAYPERGLVVRWCALRLAEQPLLAGVKHLNRLEQVLASREWSDPAIDEGLLCDQQGWLIGGTRSNVFFVRDATLCTPRLTRCGVEGTVRAVVLDAARDLGLEVAEADFRPADLADAQEVFLTNAVLGVAPVRRIGDREIVPGSIASHLRALLD